MSRTGWFLRQEQAARRHYERNRERIDRETLLIKEALEAAQADMWAAFPKPWPTDTAEWEAMYERADNYRNERITHHRNLRGV